MRAEEHLGKRWLWIGSAILLVGTAVLPAQGCGGDGLQGNRRQAASVGPCPAIIDEPTQEQIVGPAINLRAHGDPSCTNAMTAYIDDVQCTPSPPYRCHVDPGSDFSPYPNWVGVAPGRHRLVVNSWDTVGTVSQSAAIFFTYPGGGTDPVLAGAGDIANQGATQADTANLLNLINPDYVFTLGDNVYGGNDVSPPWEQGLFQGYMNYYDGTWGISSLKAKTLPNPGNHDFGNYDHSPAGIDRVMSGYYTYYTGSSSQSPTPALSVGGPTWDTLHYGYNIPTSGAPWRFISIDSGPCFYDPSYCNLNGPEYSWLANELATHRKLSAQGSYAGIVAVTHFDRYESESCGGGNSNVDAFITLLYDNGVDLILDGHIHNYERFDRIGRTAGNTTQGACGTVQGPVRDSSGPVLFNIGSGGFGGTDGFGQPYAASVARLSTNGVLKLTLRPTGFDFAFYSPSSWPNALDAGSFGIR